MARQVIQSPVTTLPLVLYSWDGASEPMACLHLNATPQFNLVLFDYSGRQESATVQIRGLTCTVLSRATECKGEIFQHFSAYLKSEQKVPEYVGLIDDDVITSVADINELLHIARCTKLDVFSASLSHDSNYSWRWTLHQGNSFCRPVQWVEVMMPFYRGELFLAGEPHYGNNVSSWGIDCYLIPVLQQLLSLPNAAIVDRIVACHRRPVTSGGKVYRNGMTANQERDVMKAKCIKLVEENAPKLLHSAWYRQTFENAHNRTVWQQIKRAIGRPIGWAIRLCLKESL